MQYTCWPVAKTFTSANTGNTASGTHWANDREMKVALWWLYEPLSSPSFSSPSPQRVIQSALHLVLMSWASMFGGPHPHLLLSCFPKPPSWTPKKWTPWPGSTLVSAGYPRGQCLVSHHLLTLPSPPSSPTVRQTAHTYVHSDMRHTNRYIRGFDVRGEGDERRLRLCKIFGSF